VSDRLAAAGMEHLEIMETGGHPVVYADWLHAPGKPTALIYGHFDVQPVDPLSLWTHPPFEPHIEDDRIYARGASDDKGNMFAPIIALEALLNERRTKRGKAPVWLTRFNKPLDEAVNEAQPTLWGGPGETCDEGHCHT
jgi:acetylornithine deacetylase/succinyl-diaminopimelate desuccinylase-like protein